MRGGEGGEGGFILIPQEICRLMIGIFQARTIIYPSKSNYLSLYTRKEKFKQFLKKDFLFFYQQDTFALPSKRAVMGINGGGVPAQCTCLSYSKLSCISFLDFNNSRTEVKVLFALLLPYEFETFFIVLISHISISSILKLLMILQQIVQVTTPFPLPHS